VAARHLIDLGHRDVLVIAIERAEHAPSGADDVVARRLRGYRTAFRPAGVEIPDEDVVIGQATFGGGLDAIQRAWQAGRRPTAIAAMSDAMAIGAIRGVRDRGLSIPADLSVVGFDDIDLSETTDPPLTTIHQPIRGKGEEAVRLLMAVIADPGRPPVHRLLATELIVRASTAVAPGGHER
jgi:LacI family transcriptional regulator